MDILPFSHLLLKKEFKFQRDTSRTFNIEAITNSLTNCLEKTHPDLDLTSSDFQLNEKPFVNCLRKFYNLVENK